MPLFRYLFLALALLFAAPPVHAQAFLPGKQATDTNPQPVKLLCWNGSAYDPCSLSGGGGGGGDASSANQLAVQAAPGSTSTRAVTVQGNVASGATDVGNPLKIGGLVNTTAPTALATGQRTDFWTTAFGALEIAGATTTGADAVANNVMRSISGQNTAALGLLLTSNYVFNGTTWDRQRGDTNGTYVVTKGGTGFVTNQVSVGTTATLVAAARAGRAKITVSIGAANNCAFGPAGVTLTNGYPLQPVAGANMPFETGAAVYGICSATTTVSSAEVF